MGYLGAFSVQGHFWVIQIQYTCFKIGKVEYLGNVSITIPTSECCQAEHQGPWNSCFFLG